MAALRALLCRFALFLCTWPVFTARSSVETNFTAAVWASAFFPAAIAVRAFLRVDLTAEITLRLRSVRVMVWRARFAAEGVLAIRNLRF